MARLIAAALLAVGLLAARAYADTYWVPPQLPQVTLQPNVPTLAMHARASRTLPPQHVVIQLALLGPPIPITPAPNPPRGSLIKAGVEDATPPPLRAVATVGTAELADARAMLEANGIHHSDIDARLLPPSGSARPIGLLSIAIEPLTPSHYAKVRNTLTSVMVDYPALRSAGTVVSMNDCGAVQTTSVVALRKAASDATSFARAIGFARGRQQYGHVSFIGDSPMYRSLCDSHNTPNPTTDFGTWVTQLSGFPDSVEGGALFRIAPGRGPAKPLNFRDASYFEHDLYDTPANQLVVPADEPFISSHGEFSGTVKPDVLVAFISFPEPSTPAAMLHKLSSVIRAHGVKASDFSEGGHTLVVRTPNAEAMAALRRDVLAAFPSPQKQQLLFAVSAGVRDCHAAQQAAESAAFAHASLRANIMARQAHVQLGTLIAVNDAGEHSGAICGISRWSSMRYVIDAARVEIGPERQGVFTSRVAVAWRIAGQKPRLASDGSKLVQPLLGGLDGAFTTYGEGVPGSASVPVAPSRVFVSLPVTQPLTTLLKSTMRSLWWENGGEDRAGELVSANPHDVTSAVNDLRAAGVTVEHLLFHAECTRAESQALSAAVQDGLSHATGHRVQAIIDQGDNDEMDYGALCGLTNNVAQKGGYVGERSIDPAAYGSFSQRVLVVTH